MAREFYRQLIHLSGIFFIFLAQFTGSLIASFYFFLIAATFLIYSYYVKYQQQKLVKLMHRIETKIRDLATSLDRKQIQMPFIGAFWFFFACGVTFLLFPLHIASAATLILAVGDALSTLVGINMGKHRITRNKTVEGSLAMFIGSLLAFIFIGYLAIPLAVIATIIEILPDLKPIRRLNERNIVDDNLLIPIICAIAIYLML